MSDISKDAASGLDFIALGTTENPKRILVVLHGTGDNCEGIKPLGELFAQNMPGTLVLIPNGPVSLAEILPPEHIEAAKQANPAFDPIQARNWAGVSKTVVTDAESMARMVEEIMTPPVTALNTLIDAQLSKHGLSDKNLALYGFSAGGMMALHTAIQRVEPCAAVVSHSGHFLGADTAVSKPKTLMIFGDQEMANAQVNEIFTNSADWLRDLGLQVEEHVCKGLAHGINDESFETAGLFMAHALRASEKNLPAKPAAPKPPQP